MKGKKRYEKLLDGLMGVAYSFAAISGGIATFEGKPADITNTILSIIAIFIIANQYEKE